MYTHPVFHRLRFRAYQFGTLEMESAPGYERLLDFLVRSAREAQHHSWQIGINVSVGCCIQNLNAVAFWDICAAPRASEAFFFDIYYSFRDTNGRARVPDSFCTVQTAHDAKGLPAKGRLAATG